MNRKTNNKSKIILGIIIIVIIALCAIYIQFSNNKDYETNNIYSNINIDISKLNIFYFNVGQADSSLILYKDKVILIDAGNESDGEKIVDFLKSKGIIQIDYLIGTHIHEDHIGGMINVINDIPIEKIFMPYNEKNNSDFYNKIKQSISNKNLSINLVKEKDEFYIDSDFLFKILYVDNTEPSETNNASIVIEVIYKEQQYLFMGDAQKEVENKLLNNGLLEDIDVLKVGHHGSDTSTTENFINKVLPEISIVSVQEGIKYKDMPNQDVIERLNAKGKVYRTDIDGTIWLKSDGTVNTITTLKELNLNGANEIGKEYILNMLF